MGRRRAAAPGLPLNAHPAHVASPFSLSLSVAASSEPIPSLKQTKKNARAPVRFAQAGPHPRYGFTLLLSLCVCVCAFHISPPSLHSSLTSGKVSRQGGGRGTRGARELERERKGGAGTCLIKSDVGQGMQREKHTGRMERVAWRERLRCAGHRRHRVAHADQAPVTGRRTSATLRKSKLPADIKQKGKQLLLRRSKKKIAVNLAATASLYGMCVESPRKDREGKGGCVVDGRRAGASVFAENAVQDGACVAFPRSSSYHILLLPPLVSPSHAVPCYGCLSFSINAELFVLPGRLGRGG